MWEGWIRSSGIIATKFGSKDKKQRHRCGTRVLGMSRNTLKDYGREALDHQEKVELARCKTFGTKSTIKMIGADRTSTNTDSRDGAVSLLEKQLCKRLVASGSSWPPLLLRPSQPQLLAHKFFDLWSRAHCNALVDRGGQDLHV